MSTANIVTARDLFHYVEDVGCPVIVAKPGLDDFESCIDRGMYGRIIGVTLKHGGGNSPDFYMVQIDLNAFEAHNEPLMQRNYYDDTGNPTLNAREANQYPKNGVEVIYLDCDTELAELFDFGPDGVEQIVTVAVKEATVYQNDGEQDVIIVELPQPMPIAGLDGNVKLTLLADEGTGVDYMREHFGIECRAETGGPDYDEILASYGVA